MIFYSRKIAIISDNWLRIASSMISLFGLLGAICLSLIAILPIASAQITAENFTGGVSYSAASGEYDYQSTTTSYSLGFEKIWGGEFYKTRFSTLFTGTNYDLRVTQTAKQQNYEQAEKFDWDIFTLNFNEPQASRSYKTSKQVHDIEESLLEIGTGDNFKFVVGRIKNDWGVFDNNNPSLSLFPRRQNLVTEFLSKDRDAILAQDQVQFHLTSGIFTFEYYNFAAARTDEDYEKDQRERLTSGRYYTQIIDIDSREIVSDFRNTEFRDEGSKALRFSLTGSVHNISDSSDIVITYDDAPYTTDAEAFRVAVKPIWGRFAFTHHKGRDMNKPLLFSSLRLLIDALSYNNTYTDFYCAILSRPAGCVLFGSDIDASVTPPPAPAVWTNIPFFTKGADYIFYPETTMDSFEIEVPFGKKIRWRFESARFETIEGLGDNGRIFFTANDSVLASGGDENANTRDRIFELISNPNRDDEVRGSILYRAVKRTTAMGIDYQGETYQGELNFIHSSAPAPINENEAEIIRLIQYFEQRADKNSYRILSNFDSQTFITGKITRKLGTEKQHEAGLVFDHILGRKGQGGFYTHNFKNNFTLSIFAGTVTLEDIGTGESYVNGEKDKDTAILQTNIAWKF